MRLLTETTIHRLPTVLLNNKLTIMIHITIPRKYVSLASGESNANAIALVRDMGSAENIKQYRTENNTVQNYEDENNLFESDLTIARLQFIHSLEGDVAGMPLFIEVVPTDSVPEGIPERTVTAEDGTVTVKTWEEWSPIDTRDGRTFVEADNGQTRLKMSELVPVFDSLVRAIDLPNNPE